MVFATYGKRNAMSQRSQSSTLLLILILVITFPVWLVVGGVLFGVIAGVLGALIGVFGALLGGFFALLALPFKILFGDWGILDGGIFHFRDNTLTIIAILILAALVVRRQRSAS